MDAPQKTEMISATEFKAKCLDILDRVNAREIDRVTITKRGRAVAVLTPVAGGVEELEAFLRSVRGTVIVPEGFDLTAPVIEGPFDAEDGKLHR